MKKYRYKEKSDILFTIFCCLIIVCINLLIQSSCDLPIIVDEIGYISYPAFISGYRWNDALCYVPYYGFGYGLFLVPVFLICKSIRQIYTAIRILNFLFIVVIFLTVKKFGNEMWKGNHLNGTVYSLICCFIPGILVFKNYALSEIIIIMVYSLMLLSFEKYITSGKTRWKTVFLFLNFYLLTIHLRMIGSVFASCILLAVYNLKLAKGSNAKRKNKKMFVLTAIMVLLIFLLAQSAISLSGIGKYDSANSLSEQIGRVIAILNLRYMKSFLLLMVSRVWTYAVSYLGLFMVGMGGLITFIVREKDNRIIYTYIFLSFAFEFFINCVAMPRVSRLDIMFHTRYSEVCIIPILYIGIMNVLERKVNIRYIFGVLAITTGTYHVIPALFNMSKDVTEFLTICVPNVSIWWKDGRFEGVLATKATVIFLLAAYFFSRMRNVLLKMVPLYFAAAIWISSAAKSIESYENTLIVQKYDFMDEIDFITKNHYQKIYAIVGTREYYVGRHYECWLQLAMPDCKIQCIPIEECYNCMDEKGAITVIPKRLIGIDEENYEEYFLCTTEYFCLLGR